MNRETALKWCGAAFVLVSLALPMSSCDMRPIAPVQETYAFEDLAVANPGSWLELGLLLWPAILASFFTWTRRRRPAFVLRLVEPLLIAASVAMVLAYSTMGQIEIGTWVALIGFALYTAGALVGDVDAVRRHRQKAPGDRTAHAIRDRVAG